MVFIQCIMDFIECIMVQIMNSIRICSLQLYLMDVRECTLLQIYVWFPLNKGLLSFHHMVVAF